MQNSISPKKPQKQVFIRATLQPSFSRKSSIQYPQERIQPEKEKKNTVYVYPLVVLCVQNLQLKVSCCILLSEKKTLLKLFCEKQDWKKPAYQCKVSSPVLPRRTSIRAFQILFFLPWCSIVNHQFSCLIPHSYSARHGVAPKVPKLLCSAASISF